MLRDLGDVEAAERAYLKALEEMKTLRDGGATQVGGVYNSLAGIAMSRKQFDKAREYYDASLEALGPPEGPRGREILLARANRAVLMRKQGDIAGAEKELRDVVERSRTLLSDKEPFLVQIETGLAITVAEHGRMDEAAAIQVEENRFEELLRDGLLRGDVGDEDGTAPVLLREDQQRLEAVFGFPRQHAE